MSDAASTRLRRGVASACVLLTAIATTVTFTPANAAPSDEKAGPTPGSTGRTTVGQLLTPAGQLTTLGDLPLNEVLSPDGKYLVISNNGQGTQSLQVAETASGEVVQTIPYKSPESLYMGLAFSPDGKHLFASAAGNHKIRTYHFDCGKLVETTAIQMPVISPKRKKVNLYPAGLAVTKDSKRLVVADQLADAVSVIDLATNKVQTTHIGHRPVWVTLSKDSTKAFVSSQGGSDVAEVDITKSQPKHSVIQSGPPIYDDDDDDDDEGEEVKPGDVDLDEVGSYSKDSRGFPVWTPDGDDERFDPARGIDPCAPKPSPKPTPTPTPKPGAPVPTTAAPSASSGGNNGGGHALPRTGA